MICKVNVCKKMKVTCTPDKKKGQKSPIQYWHRGTTRPCRPIDRSRSHYAIYIYNAGVNSEHDGKWPSRPMHVLNRPAANAESQTERPLVTSQ